MASTCGSSYRVLPRSPGSDGSGLRECPVKSLSLVHITERTSKYSDIRKSRNPDIRISGFPDIRISGNPDIRKSRNPDIRISGNPDIRFSPCQGIHLTSPEIQCMSNMSNMSTQEWTVSYVKMPILNGPGKMSNPIEKKCQMGSRGR